MLSVGNCWVILNRIAPRVLSFAINAQKAF
jgi:hypothetical protein